MTDGAFAAGAVASTVTLAEAAEAGPVPARFVAVTVNAYDPSARLVIVHVSVPVAVHVFPPGDAVAVYFVIVEPPFEAGAFQATLTLEPAGVAVTPVEAPGFVAIV